MSPLQQFAELPADLQQEVLDFMSYVAEKRGIKLGHSPPAKPNWLKTVNRKRGTGEAISDSVVRLRQEGLPKDSTGN